MLLAEEGGGVEFRSRAHIALNDHDFTGSEHPVARAAVPTLPSALHTAIGHLSASNVYVSRDHHGARARGERPLT